MITMSCRLKELHNLRLRWIDKSNSEIDQGATSEVTEVVEEVEADTMAIEEAEEGEWREKGGKDLPLTVKVTPPSSREEKIDERYKPNVYELIKT